MKTLKYTNANKALNVEYLVDLIGDSNQLTIYEISHTIGETKILGIGTNGQLVGLPTQDDQIANDENTLTKLTLSNMVALAVSKNLSMEIHTQGVLSPAVENTLTELAMVTTVIQDGIVDTEYEFIFEAEGGNTGYIWTTESTLPAGLTLGLNGVLYGTPTETGTSTITVVCTDLFGITVSLTDADIVIGEGGD